LKSHYLKHYGKRYGWLVGLVSFCWMVAPAKAGQLSAWQFSSDRNQLEFTTDAGVQPRAQLVADPTRLVIDLPGTTIGRVATSQAIGQAVRQIQIGQLDAQTTRMIVELAPGYTIDPQQVKFHGISPTHWTVQLPEPQVEASSTAIAPLQPPAPSRAISPSPAPTLINSVPGAVPDRATRPATPVNPDITQVEEVRLTADGLFVRTSGARPEVEVTRSRRDRDIITIAVANAALLAQIAQPIAINQYGISTLELSQSANRQASQRDRSSSLRSSSTESSSVQITLHVAPESPDWQAFASGSGGIVMLPQGGVGAVARLAPPAARSTAPTSRAAIASQSQISQSQASRSQASRSQASQSQPAQIPASQPRSSPLAPETQPATIAGVALNPNSNQLLIHSDRPVTYSGRWQSGMYQITLSPAQLADRVTGSDIGGAASLVRRVQLRQQTDTTVIVSVQPATGVRFGTLNLVSPQLLALQVDRAPIPSATAPSSGRTSAGSAAVVLPNRIPSMSLPRLQSGRFVVVLDPGHGGSDPGAVGINGLQEKQVTLAIAQQVAAYLTQQGVQVILTRTDDSDVELEPRVQMAEQDRASLFVSIHANSLSLDRPDVNGIETYYYSSGEQMAQVIQDSIVQGTGMNDKGIHSARFYVLRRTSMPAVLVETGFVTGSDDAPRLASPGFQNQMALSIAQGILRYAQQNSTALNR
jgi:N-acetylmuramoyl-L-alanine amidase